MRWQLHSPPGQAAGARHPAAAAFKSGTPVGGSVESRLPVRFQTGGNPTTAPWLLPPCRSSIEHLKSSFEAEAQQQPAAPATTLTSAPAEQPSAISEGRRWIGELQPDGSILFQSLDTCCGHVVSQEADGTTTFHFD